VALVVVDATLHDRDRLARELPEVELAGVALDGRHREVRDVAVRDHRLDLEALRELAEPGAEDDADLGLNARLLLHRGRGFLDLGHQLAGHLRFHGRCFRPDENPAFALTLDLWMKPGCAARAPP